MTDLAKKETNSRTSGEVCWAWHHLIGLKTNVITLGNMFQPSYLTEIQIWLVSGYLRLRMPEKKRCDTIWRDDIVRFSGNELWKRVPKQDFNIKPGKGWGGSWWTQWQLIEISKKMNFHNYVNQGDVNCQIRWYDVCLRKTYRIKDSLKGAPEIWVGLHDQCQNDDSIVNSLRMNGRPLASKQ